MHVNPNSPPPKVKTWAVRYAEMGAGFGALAGIWGNFDWATSSRNPNRGHLLGLEQDAIIFASTFGLSLICAGIGWVLGKMKDFLARP